MVNDAEIKGLMSIIHWITLGTILESECFKPFPGKMRDYLVTYLSQSWSGEGITISYQEGNGILLKVYLMVRKGSENLIHQAEELQRKIHEEISLLPGCLSNKVHIIVKGVAE